MSVARHERIDELAGEWDELADRVEAVPWLRPGWVEAWWRAFGRGSLELVAVRRGGRLAGLVPLARRGGRRGAPANWHTPEFALLAEDDSVRSELAVAVFDGSPRAVELSFLPPESSGLVELRAEAGERRYRLLVRPQMRSPYVEVQGSWDEYLEGRDRKTRKEIERRRRQLERLGNVRFEIERGRERLDELLAEGFRIEGSGWKTKRGTAILSRPETHRFYVEIARWAVGRGSLRLLFLRLNGRAIGFELMLEENRRLYDVKGGYDAEFRRYGVGMMNAQEMVAYAFANGLESFEFLGSEEPYKAAWTETVRERLRFQAFAPTLAGRAEWAAYAYGRPVVKRLLALRGR